MNGHLGEQAKDMAFASLTDESRGRWNDVPNVITVRRRSVTSEWVVYRLLLFQCELGIGFQECSLGGRR